MDKTFHVTQCTVLEMHITLSAAASLLQRKGSGISQVPDLQQGDSWFRLWRDQELILSQIANANQTPINFDTPLSRTVEQRGAHGVLFKTTSVEKQHCMVMLAITILESQMQWTAARSTTSGNAIRKRPENWTTSLATWTNSVEH